MAKPLVSDELWSIVEPLIPKRPPHDEKGGRPPIDDLLDRHLPSRTALP